MKREKRLYTYVLRYDDGAAPNPYWGYCTLAICKPVIRKGALPGDWVVGFCTKERKHDYNGVGNDDASYYVAYAMEVKESIMWGDYKGWCESHCSSKVPVPCDSEYSKQVGDCIYFEEDKVLKGPILSVHNTGKQSTEQLANIKATDTNGNVLIATNFWYFGNSPERIPPHLNKIRHPYQGQKYIKNQDFLGPFVEWINSIQRGKDPAFFDPAFKVNPCQTQGPVSSWVDERNMNCIQDLNGPEEGGEIPLCYK